MTQTDRERALEEATQVCEKRADYFGRAKGWRSWEDAERSYRATAREIRKLTALAAPSPAPAPASHDDVARALRDVNTVVTERRKIKYAMPPEAFQAAFRDQHKNDHCIDADDLWRIQATEAAITIIEDAAALRRATGAVTDEMYQAASDAYDGYEEPHPEALRAALTAAAKKRTK